MDCSYISLSEAARLAPGKPHVSSLWRWCRRGVKARGGDRVHLEHVRAGGRVYTTAESLTRFFEAVAAADAEHFNSQTAPTQPATRTDNQRERAVRSAERKLAGAGIL